MAEVDRHVAELRAPGRRSGDALPLAPLGVRVVHLEDAGRRERVQAVRPRVEPRAEEYALRARRVVVASGARPGGLAPAGIARGPGRDRRAHRVVDRARPQRHVLDERQRQRVEQPRDGRASRAEAPQRREPRAERPTDERVRERVEVLRLRVPRHARHAAREGDELCGEAAAPAPHAPSDPAPAAASPAWRGAPRAPSPTSPPCGPMGSDHRVAASIPQAACRWAPPE